MNIVKYIIEILEANDKVVIPGFGSFILEYQASILHPVEHSFVPPSSKIVFQNDVADDDSLAIAISEKEKITYIAALNAIKYFTDALMSDIQKGKMTGIEGLGVFSLSENNQIEFHAETSSLSAEEFGLSGFTSPAIVRTEFKDKAAQNTLKAKEDKIKRSKKIKRNLSILAAIIVVTALIFLVFFTDIFRNYMYNNAVKTENKPAPTALVNEMPAPVDSTVIDSVHTTDTAQSTTQNSTSAITKQVPGNVTANLNSTVANSYYLVAGSFKSEENAKKRVSELTAKGFKNAGIIRQYEDKGMFVVYYESHPTKEEATKALQQLIKTENHEAWLLKK